MIWLVRTRHLHWLLATTFLLELTAVLWAGQAFTVTHGGYFSAVPLAVVLQVIVAALLAYAMSSNTQLAETISARPMRVIQLALSVTTTLVIGAACTVMSLMIGDTGTLGTLSPLKALIGAWGMALLATSVFDRRLAGLLPIACVILPMTVSPAEIPFGESWGFAFAPDTSATAWVTAFVLLVMGLASSSSFVARQRR